MHRIVERYPSIDPLGVPIPSKQSVPESQKKIVAKGQVFELNQHVQAAIQENVIVTGRIKYIGRVLLPKLFIYFLSTPLSINNVVVLD